MRSLDEVGEAVRTRKSKRGSKRAADDNGEGGAGKKRQRMGGS